MSGRRTRRRTVLARDVEVAHVLDANAMAVKGRERHASVLGHPNAIVARLHRRENGCGDDEDEGADQHRHDCDAYGGSGKSRRSAHVEQTTFTLRR